MGQIVTVDTAVDDRCEMSRESGGNCEEIFSKIIDVTSIKAASVDVLKAALLDTRLGSMIAIANESSLLLLEFLDCRGLAREVERLSNSTKSVIVPGRTHIIDSVENELDDYFGGRQQQFSTPITLFGTAFQKKVWQELIKIPFGETRSYADIARAINQPAACRAVVRANGANQLAVIIPCHRVINSDGKLGGYSGGVARKVWLIDYEKIGGAAGIALSS